MKSENCPSVPEALPPELGQGQSLSLEYDRVSHLPQPPDSLSPVDSRSGSFSVTNWKPVESNPPVSRKSRGRHRKIAGAEVRGRFGLGIEFAIDGVNDQLAGVNQHY